MRVDPTSAPAALTAIPAAQRTGEASRSVFATALRAATDTPATTGTEAAETAATTTGTRSADTATWMAPAVPPSTPATDSSTYALAWSQDDPAGEDVVPYTGPDIETEPVNPYRLSTPPETVAEDDVKPWQRLPLSVLGLGWFICLAIGALHLNLTR